MKKKKQGMRLSELREKITNEINDWKNININGCNDPSWPDGVNMNLVRNHIIYYKREMAQICEEINLILPEEFYFPTPQEVDNGYMAHIHTSRAKKLKDWGDDLTTKKQQYDDQQMCLF